MINTFCSKSWTDLNIDFQNKEIKYCCKSKKIKFNNDLNVNWVSNNKQLLERRNALLKGVEHNDCTLCWNDYRKTNTSYREATNTWTKEFVDSNIIELNTEKFIKYIEIKFDNTCDLSCLYCTPYSSSKIAQQRGKIIKDKANDKDIDIFKEWCEQFLRNSENSKQVTINFLGGEPTLSKQFFNLVEYFNRISTDYPSKTITLEICTNGNSNEATRSRLYDIMYSNDKLKWRIGISNEGTENYAKLVRYGLDWNNFCDNLKFYANCPNVVGIVLAPTINALSLPHLPEYIRFIVNFLNSSLIKSFSWHGNMISTPSELDICNLSLDYQCYLRESISILTDELDISKIDHFQRFINFLKLMQRRLGSNYNPHYKSNIIKFLEVESNYKKDSSIVEFGKIVGKL